MIQKNITVVQPWIHISMHNDLALFIRQMTTSSSDVSQMIKAHLGNNVHTSLHWQCLIKCYPRYIIFEPTSTDVPPTWTFAPANELVLCLDLQTIYHHSALTCCVPSIIWFLTHNSLYQTINIFNCDKELCMMISMWMMQQTNALSDVRHMFGVLTVRNRPKNRSLWNAKTAYLIEFLYSLFVVHQISKR